MNLNFGERNADEGGRQPKETLASAVYHQIKREIINGDLAPGLKLKVRQEQEVVVVGWLTGQGTHTDIGSLILGVRSGDRWVHAGQVGSGINTRTRRDLLRQLEAIERDDSPLDPAPRLKGARWVEPRIVIRVEFAEWTADDLLRQAAYKGIEPDKDPRDVLPQRPDREAHGESGPERASPVGALRLGHVACPP